MDVIAFLISLILLLISLAMFRNKPLHPATLLCDLYSVILFFSILNLFNIYKPSDEAYILISVMLCSFWAGSLLGCFVGVRTHILSPAKDSEHLLNVVLYNFFVILSIAFLLFDVFLAVKYILAGIPAWQVRNWSLEEFGQRNPILERRSFVEELFRTVVLSPIGMLIPPVTAYTFFDARYKKSRNGTLVLAIVQVVLTCIAGGGGRLRMVYFCGCFVIAYLLFSNKKLFAQFRKSKYKKYIVIVGGVSFVGIVLMTWLRIGFNSLWQQIYTYFALPPTLLSIWLPSIKEAERTYGMLSFYGIFGYFFRTLKMLQFDFLVPNAYDNAFRYIINAQTFVKTGYGSGNAFVTPVYYLFLDGGKGFLCCMSILFGILTSKLHKKVCKKADVRNFVVYALVMYGVFETFMTIMTAVPTQILSIIFVYLFCGKKAR